MITMLLLFGAINHPSQTVDDRYDLVEINHLYNDEGELVWDQLIFRNWCPRECRFVVEDARVFRTVELPTPHKDWQQNEYHLTWVTGGDSYEKAVRSIRFKQIRETWTQEDPMADEQPTLRVRRRLRPAPENLENDLCGHCR